MSLALLGVYFVGNKNRIGFPLLMLCCILWGIVAVRSEIWGLLIETTCLFFLNFRAYIKWGKKITT